MGVSQAELDALRIAIDTEKEGYHFFKKAKEMAKTEITRDLFDTLMKDELLHQKVIEEYYQKLTNEGSRKEVKEVEAELQKSSGTFKTIFSEAAENPEKVLEGIEDDIKNVQLAIDFEKNGQNMYRKLARTVTDPKAVQFYEFLERMEEEHEEALDETLRYLRDPDSYYLNAEGWTME
jgi:rubrerythrin